MYLSCHASAKQQEDEKYATNFTRINLSKLNREDLGLFRFLLPVNCLLLDY